MNEYRMMQLFGESWRCRDICRMRHTSLSRSTGGGCHPGGKGRSTPGGTGPRRRRGTGQQHHLHRSQGQRPAGDESQVTPLLNAH